MDIYIVELYNTGLQRWMIPYDFQEANSQGNIYYMTRVDRIDKDRIVRQARKHHIRYRAYQECYARSSGYRSAFFRENGEKNHCRYCGKRLTKSSTFVDHVIPVAKAKSDKWARFLLKIRGINNVNDVRNLVPACYRCNKRKGTKMGLWVLRGWIGMPKFFIAIRTIFYLAIVIGVGALIWTQEVSPALGGISFLDYVDHFVPIRLYWSEFVSALQNFGPRLP